MEDTEEPEDLEENDLEELDLRSPLLGFFSRSPFWSEEEEDSPSNRKLPLDTGRVELTLLLRRSCFCPPP